MLAVGEHLLGRVDPQIVKMTTGFSGGVGVTYRDQCGALSSGIMLIGALHGRTQSGVDDSTCQQLSACYRDRFQEELGSIYCGELRAERFGSKNQEPCSKLVERATRLLLDVVDDPQPRHK
jgi:C_GCAxxG_C_C family probable redox protein